MKENKASITAYTVLQGIMYVAKRTKYKDLVPKDMKDLGEKVLSCSEEGQKRLAQLEKKGFALGVKIREYIFLPGITLHYILRKRAIEHRTREFLKAGVKQVVCLGAGFDSLALRLAEEMPDVNFIEIDHPDTQQFKAQALQESQRENLHYLSIDFTHQNLEDRLKECTGFTPSLPSLYICEGVTMYLTSEEITHMFTAIHNLSGTGTKFLFTALEPQDSPRNNTRKILDYYLKLIGEPIKWTMESPELEAFLKQQKCKILSLDETDQFRDMFLKGNDPVTLHRGEYLAAAEFERR
ncbi:class I SAM-dependent methyltransferase [Terasakiella pusilla]|uniref:class I SAM-dependent methyltransferase n=1 Tax=Terasakiella pusilla TaxID=64973 RepID=UPI003AA87520